MSSIILETKINSTAEICFDLSRSVDLHMASAEATNERAIEGVTSGLMKLGDSVTWEATHFGFKQKLKVEISLFDRPNSFQDKQVKGIFKSYTHDHTFFEENGMTLMKEAFEFQCPFGVLGKIAEPFVFWHLKKFLKKRNQLIKSVAESGDWKKFINH